MHIENLVKMANNIGDFFQSDPDHEAAVHAVADHLKKFWDPRMRKQIIKHYDEGGEGLRELTRESVRLLAEENAALTQCGDG
ncbi:formate dehydrogenase subunit delta [Methylococcus sp. EFPC2]|uniref:formate dehydrogenase subunit delta n=1 Tax=Methylococcus sp. EFPC2 TaxID=2812648 RepID=UPI0019678492|nr:formate dehydrogenase subunit delta [Methylococcus sp. EFPC2]QSA97169.1 formate dehydrogenase subunit delta [Methylococcus sp. EFPC2]